MIERLHIKNFALIDEIEVNFKNGLNVITGETGTGKSILINALSILIGEKFSKDVLSNKNTVVEGIFVFENKRLKKILEQKGLEYEDYLTIKVIFKEGRRRIFINNSPTTLSTLKAIGDSFIDIHGQHEHQSLFKQNQRREILDEYTNILEELNEYKKLYNEYIKEKEDYTYWKNKIKQLQEKLDLYLYQAKEIEENYIKDEEYEELKQRKELLETAEQRYSVSSKILKLINEGTDETEISILSLMYEIHNLLSSLKDFDKRAENWRKTVQESLINIEEIEREISYYKTKIEFSQEELENINEKIFRAEQLMKKYGNNMNKVNSYYEEIKKYIEESNTFEEEDKRRIQKIKNLRERLEKLADKIHNLRQEGGISFSKKVVEILKNIGFQKPVFEIKITKQDNLSDKGWDRVDFLFSANPDFLPYNIEKIVSGGEMSRVMLAIKSTVANKGGINIMIFDEIDTGIGGSTADKVGRELKELSKFKQILCVTHLPQIAAKANNHIFVDKKLINKKTFIKVKTLNKEERIKEIARMISGKEVTKSAIKHAGEIIEN